MRCYNFDTVLAAFDNFGTLVDTVAAGGNGNTYKLECTETTNQANYMKRLTPFDFTLTPLLSPQTKQVLLIKGSLC